MLAIGRVTVNGARLEFDIVVFLWAGLGHAAPTRARGDQGVQVPTDQFSRAVDDLRRWSRRGSRAVCFKDFRAYLDGAKSAAEQRHRVVHGMWTATPDQFGRHRCRGLRASPLTGQPVIDRWSAADVAAIADELHNVRGRLVLLLPRLLSAIPELSRSVHQGPVLSSGAGKAPGVA